MEKAPILVTGMSGVLGWNLCHFLARQGWSVVGTYRQNGAVIPNVESIQLNLEETDTLEKTLQEKKFSAVIHTAALTNPDHCENDRALAQRVNVDSVRILSEWAAPVPFVFISTDLIFDGEKGCYQESDSPNPLNFYGETKCRAEEIILERESGMVVRVAKLYSSGSPFHACFTNWMKERFERGERLKLFRDQYRTPILVDDVSRALEKVLQSPIKDRLFHLGGPQRLSRVAFGQAFARVFGYDDGLIEPVSAEEVGLVARGNDCSLDSRKFWRSYDFQCTSTLAGLELLRSRFP